jgi:hypothetical protein
MSCCINPNTTRYNCYGQPVNCPQFTIKQHDTRPSFKVEVTDCNAPIDLANLVIEASMWSNAKLKCNLTPDTTVIQFADNVGFQQLNYDTIIQVGDGRLFERMLIDQINDVESTITVFRGQMGTIAVPWKRGTQVKILRFLNNPAVGELVYGNIDQPDGTIINDALVASLLIYDWKPADTCMAGLYFLEFKIMKMTDVPMPCSGYIETVMAPPAGNINLPPLNGMPTFMPPAGGAALPWTSGNAGQALDYSINVPFVIPQVSCNNCITEEEYIKQTVHVRDEFVDNLPNPAEPINAAPQMSMTGSDNYVVPYAPVAAVTASGCCGGGCWPPPWTPPVSHINYHCGMGQNVEWVRRFPTNQPGFLIEIFPSPTAE